MRTFRPHPDVTVFNDQLEVPGIGHLPINAYVLHAEQPVVVDTGLGLDDRDFVRTLGEAIDPADVRWIWLTHPDRDHTGGIFALLEAAPNARIVTTFAGVGIMSTESPLPMDRVYLLNPGQTLDVGDRTLTGFRPPLFDNPATVGFFESKSGIFFSSDCFGAPMGSADLASADSIGELSDDELAGRQLLWTSIDSPWVQAVDPTIFASWLQPVRDFDPSWIFSTHLPPASGDKTRIYDNALAAVGCSPFVGPDQAALEAMLASFEPV